MPLNRDTIFDRKTWVCRLYVIIVVFFNFCSKHSSWVRFNKL